MNELAIKREKTLAKKKEYREKNKDKIKEARRIYYNQNKNSDEYKKKSNYYSKKWKENNPDKVKKAKNKWKLNNLDKVRESQRKYEKKMRNSDEYRKKSTERTKIWKENNREKNLAQKRKYRIKHASKIRLKYLKSDSDLGNKITLWNEKKNIYELWNDENKIGEFKNKLKNEKKDKINHGQRKYYRKNILKLKKSKIRDSSDINKRKSLW